MTEVHIDTATGGVIDTEAKHEKHDKKKSTKSLRTGRDQIDPARSFASPFSSKYPSFPRRLTLYGILARKFASSPIVAKALLFL
ncbi:MAG: hypothetical protein U0361_07885 [Nitrospiraceae bacterium]